MCARNVDGVELVRHPCTGRWFVEAPAAKPRRVSLEEAVRLVRGWRADGVGDLCPEQPGSAHLTRKVLAAGVRRRV